MRLVLGYVLAEGCFEATGGSVLLLRDFVVMQKLMGEGEIQVSLGQFRIHGDRTLKFRDRFCGAIRAVVADAEKIVKASVFQSKLD